MPTHHFFSKQRENLLNSSLYFITSNENKLREFKYFLPELKWKKVELLEIQDIDPKKIIRAKLMQALAFCDGRILVEDSSLFFEGLKGLPGPFIKFFEESLGYEGLYKLAKTFGNFQTTAVVTIGYATSKEDIALFEGRLQGTIVFPKGDNGFGWDSIFQPEGFNQTLAEMSLEQKSTISIRRQAIKQFQEFLNSSTVK